MNELGTFPPGTPESDIVALLQGSPHIIDIQLPPSSQGIGITRCNPSPGVVADLLGTGSHYDSDDHTRMSLYVIGRTYLNDGSNGFINVRFYNDADGVVHCDYNGFPEDQDYNIPQLVHDLMVCGAVVDRYLVMPVKDRKVFDGVIVGTRLNGFHGRAANVIRGLLTEGIVIHLEDGRGIFVRFEGCRYI